MEINNVIVYFPWGAGGNFIQNVLSLAPGYQMLSYTGDDVENKVEFIKEYYSQDVTPATWLRREWSTRVYFGNRYCNGESPAYWNPEYSLVYTTHGENRMMDSLNSDTKLKHWDRYNVKLGNIPEQLCHISTHDFCHVFMIPDNIEQTTKVYHSKNPDLTQLRKDNEDDYVKFYEALTINIRQCINLYKLRNTLVENGKHVVNISPDRLLTDEGYLAIIELTNNLHLTIDVDIIKQLHELWLTATRKCYTAFHKKNL